MNEEVTLKSVSDCFSVSYLFLHVIYPELLFQVNKTPSIASFFQAVSSIYYSRFPLSDICLLNEFMRYLILPVFLLLSSTTCAQLHGKVIRISDGDTFILLTASSQPVRVRLYGIDCPEKVQDFGNVARQYLSYLIFDKEVSVEVKGKDPYQRLIGITKVKGLNVNEALLNAGLAWQYTRYDHSTKWAGMEKRARDNKIGLWSKANPTPPWVYRKNKKVNLSNEKITGVSLK